MRCHRVIASFFCAMFRSSKIYLRSHVFAFRLFLHRFMLKIPVLSYWSTIDPVSFMRKFSFYPSSANQATKQTDADCIVRVKIVKRETLRLGKLDHKDGQHQCSM